MLARKASKDAFRTWILRLVGILLGVFGIMLIFSPITKAASYIPLLGGFIGFDAE